MRFSLLKLFSVVFGCPANLSARRKSEHSKVAELDSPRKLVYVDVLRAIAIILVILVHAGHYAPDGSYFKRLSKYGHHGVQLFFVMSAFTLCHSAARERERGGFSVKKFAIRRFFRIAPLYYIAIPFYLLVSVGFITFSGSTPFTDPRLYNAKQVFTNLVFAHGLLPFGNNTIVPGGWSIGCEFAFYVSFPVIFWFASRGRNWLVFYLFLGVLIQMAVPFSNWFGDAYGTMIYSQWPCFIIGMVYFYWRSSGVFRRVVLLLAACALIGVFLWHKTQWWLGDTTGYLVGVGAVALALVVERVRGVSILERIGQLSFSMYIVHFAIVWSVGALWPLDSELESVLFLGLVTSLTVGVAQLLHFYVESPCIEIGRDLSRRVDRGVARD